MANLDNTSKRRSSVQILQPYPVAPPNPTGDLDAADRANILSVYSGISAYDIIDLTSTLFISDSVTVSGTEINQSLTSTLVITETVSGSALSTSVLTVLNIQDFVVQNFDLIPETTTNLHITDDAFGKFAITSLSVQSTLHFFEEVTGNINVQQYTVSSVLEIVDSVSRVRSEQNISSTLAITDNVFGSIGLESNLVIVDTVDYNLSKNLISTLIITDSVIPISDRSFALTTSLDIHDSVIAYIPAKVNNCNFNAIGIPPVPVYEFA